MDCSNFPRCVRQTNVCPSSLSSIDNYGIFSLYTILSHKLIRKSFHNSFNMCGCSYICCNNNNSSLAINLIKYIHVGYHLTWLQLSIFFKIIFMNDLTARSITDICQTNVQKLRSCHYRYILYWYESQFMAEMWKDHTKQAFRYLDGFLALNDSKFQKFCQNIS